MKETCYVFYSSQPTPPHLDCFSVGQNDVGQGGRIVRTPIKVLAEDGMHRGEGVAHNRLEIVVHRWRYQWSQLDTCCWCVCGYAKFLQGAVWCVTVGAYL